MKEAIKRLRSIGERGMRESAYREVDDSLALYRQDLELVLHKPTSDEVCKALSEYWKEEVKYIPNKVKRYGFYLVESGAYIICLSYDNEILLHHNDYIKANKYPPHLITLIGRFYEGLEVKE